MRSQYLLPAVFLVAWLLSLFLSYLRQRSQSEAQREIDRKALPVLPRESAPPLPRVMASRASPLPVVTPLVDRPQHAPSRLGSPREVRRGMVLMTILGPCRALEPPELPR
jgi:hypothetical protein